MLPKEESGFISVSLKQILIVSAASTEPETDGKMRRTEEQQANNERRQRREARKKKRQDAADAKRPPQESETDKKRRKKKKDRKVTPDGDAGDEVVHLATRKKKAEGEMVVEDM